MKVLLINPPAAHTIVGNNPEIIDAERGHNPPLSILFLAAQLLDTNRHEVRVLDCQVEEMGYPQLERAVFDHDPDLVGLTAMTLTLVDVVKTAQVVRRVNADIPIVVGGPHPAIYPAETARLPTVDYVLQGEAEYSFVDLIDRLADGADRTNDRHLAAVAGLFYEKDGQIKTGGPPGFIEDLDALPFPARQLTAVEKYTSLLAKRQPVTTMFTSRGCPFRCTFCHRPAMGKRFRAMSAARVVDEMEVCLDLGIREILIYDDTFTVKKKRVWRICHEILRRGLDVVWDVRAHVSTVDPDLLRLMKRAGCARIHYGIEAGTNRILKKLRKGITVEQARRVLTETRRAGISTLAYFMIGNPTETHAEAEQTLRFARSLDADYVHVTILTPFPGTPLYLEGLRDGVFSHDHWKAFAQNPRADFKPPFWEEHMDSETLQQLIRRAYQSFYLRPGYVLRRLTELRSPGELVRKARAAWKVVTMR
jgi:radical SAM superfamily enzyme YgiQ (UPF0313 family)